MFLLASFVAIISVNEYIKNIYFKYIDDYYRIVGYFFKGKKIFQISVSILIVFFFFTNYFVINKLQFSFNI